MTLFLRFVISFGWNALVCNMYIGVCIVFTSHAVSKVCACDSTGEIVRLSLSLIGDFGFASSECFGSVLVQFERRSRLFRR